MTGQTRASDEDRQRIIDALQEHTAAGRLSLDEFTERVGHAYAARTLGELAAVTHDLPSPARPVVSPDHSRQLLLALGAAVLTLLLVALLMALR